MNLSAQNIMSGMFRKKILFGVVSGWGDQVVRLDGEINSNIAVQYGKNSIKAATKINNRSRTY
jgi:hypothetical protein